MKVGATFSTFDLSHAGCINMLAEVKKQCDYLICSVQIDSTIDHSVRNKPVQSVVERYIQLRGCKYMDEIVPYTTEQDLEDILRSFHINVCIIGDEYATKMFTDRNYCGKKGIKLYFNKIEHYFSSRGLRKEVHEKKIDLINKRKIKQNY
ncbi:Cytidylyltransferase [Tenacibaculum sp. 190524A02b]|uniref:adenylyltransferase/cytidyltransferase family protein n=1 Tax=Tenacibaculum vairaonense TaxID=3137860 RepID=UPI0032B15CBB